MKQDWLGLSCFPEEEIELFKAIGIDYAVLDFSDTPPIRHERDPNEYIRKTAFLLGEYAKTSMSKPFVVGTMHYIMTYAVPRGVDVIYFDNHVDDYPEEEFTNGSFERFVDAKRQIVLGATGKQYGNTAEVFPPGKIEEFMTQPLQERLFLSIDLDVLDRKYYDARDWSQGTMSPNDVRSIVSRLIAGRDVVGLNVAGYRPSGREVVKRILSSLCDFR
jgi:arginase family enzyme